MIGSVRERILRAMTAALAGIGRVGAVVAEGEAESEAIGALTSAGKFVLELLAGDDEVWEEGQALGLEAWTFAAGVLVHLPVPPGGEDRSPRDVAADICGEIYLAHSGDEEKGTWGSLAVRTDAIGGGGVFYDEDGRLVTRAAWRVYYRHRRGNPTEAA